MKMNNGPTPRWQRVRRLGVAFFFTDFDRRSNDEEHPYDGNDPTIRAHVWIPWIGQGESLKNS